MELQTAFYIIGIVFMTLMTVVIVAILAAILVIKAKINRLHDVVDERVTHAKSIANKATSLLKLVTAFMPGRRA